MFNLFSSTAVPVTASSGAATSNNRKVNVTSEALTTAAGSSYTLTLTNKFVTANSLVCVQVCFGSSTTGEPCVTTVTPASGSVVVKVKNVHASAAFNGTIKISLLVI